MEAFVELNPGVVTNPLPPPHTRSSSSNNGHVVCFFHTLVLLLLLLLSMFHFSFLLFSQRLASCYFYTFDRPTGTNVVFTFHGCMGIGQGRQTGNSSGRREIDATTRRMFYTFSERTYTVECT